MCNAQESVSTVDRLMTVLNLMHEVCALRQRFFNVEQYLKVYVTMIRG